MEEVRLVQLDLRSRKVYVGYAVDSSVGKGADADVVLFPVCSGYRREDTLELIMNVDYWPVLEGFLLGEYESDEEARATLDFVVVIPLEEVVSARLFDVEVYNAFYGIWGEEGGEEEDEEEQLVDEAVWPVMLLWAAFLVFMIGIVGWLGSKLVSGIFGLLLD